MQTHTHAASCRRKIDMRCHPHTANTFRQHRLTSPFVRMKFQIADDANRTPASLPIDAIVRSPCSTIFQWRNFFLFDANAADERKWCGNGKFHANQRHAICQTIAKQENANSMNVRQTEPMSAMLCVGWSFCGRFRDMRNLKSSGKLCVKSLVYSPFTDFFSLYQKDLRRRQNSFQLAEIEWHFLLRQFILFALNSWKLNSIKNVETFYFC